MILFDDCTMDDSVEGSRFKVDQSTGTLSMKHTPFGMATNSKIPDDDDTELLSSFASMMVSSIETLGESSWNNSLSTSTQHLTMLPKVKEEIQFHLRKNEHDCFGYLQFHGSVSCIHEVPTELSVVSGKVILYVLTGWVNGNSEATVDALTHPLVLEAIESLFIPVAIIPNRTENQPYHQLRVTSIGFMDSSHQDLLDPIAVRERSICPVLESAMLFVLEKNEQQIPTYLADIVQSHFVNSGSSQGLNEFQRRAWFGFHDNIPAASELQCLDGVASVQCGTFLDYIDDPIVEVTYNYKVTSYSALVLHVLTQLSSRQIFIYCQSNDERMAARVEITKLSRIRTYERQIALVRVSKSVVFEPVNENNLAAIQQTPLRYVPMTEFQASETNRLVMDGQYDKATALLSPRQLKILLASVSNGFENFFDVVGYSLLDGWMSIMDKKPPHRQPRAKDECEIDSELELHCI